MIDIVAAYADSVNPQSIATPKTTALGVLRLQSGIVVKRLCQGARHKRWRITSTPTGAHAIPQACRFDPSWPC
jgi:hypothetical protein